MKSLERKTNNLVVFDYNILTPEEKLQTLENEKKLDDLYNKYKPELGKILYEQQQVLANHDNGVFAKWYESKGLKRGKVYHYINTYKYVFQILEDPNQKEMFSELQESLQIEMSKPSALPEVNQAVFDGDITTHKEYKEMEKRLKEQERIIAKQAETIDLKNNTIAEKDDIIYRQGEQKTQVIEIEKEVIPSDYETLKLELEDLRQRAKENDKQLEELKKIKDEELEKATKYDGMTESIRKMEGKMNETQEKLQAQKQVYELLETSKELLMKITPMPYLIDKKYVRENEIIKRELKNTAEQVYKFYKNLKELLNETEILEGEIIHEK